MQTVRARTEPAFADNRPEATVQLRQQAIVQQQPQAGILQAAAPATASPHVVQLAKGQVYQNGSTFVVYSLNSYGPYTIYNYQQVAAYLAAGKKIDYQQSGQPNTVIITQIDGHTFDAQAHIQSIQSLNTNTNNSSSSSSGWTVDTSFGFTNNLGLRPVAKEQKNDRPISFGSSFKVDFQPEMLFPGLGRPSQEVEIDSGKSHHSLHSSAPRSDTMGRGNSIGISWELYYYTNDTRLMRQTISPQGMQSNYKSADFKEHSKEDLNKLFAMGRHVTGNQQFTNNANFTTASAQWHSERAFLIAANENELVTNLAQAINEVLIPGDEQIGTPQLLIIHLHSHENAICPTCYSFLTSFMSGSWITQLQAAVIDGPWMQVKMVTSADEQTTSKDQAKKQIANKQKYTLYSDDDAMHMSDDWHDEKKDDDEDKGGMGMNPMPSIFNFNQLGK